MATGDAPIMKQKNYKVDQEKKVEWIIAFIRKYLKLEDPESLVNYNFLLLLFMSAIGQSSFHLPLLQSFQSQGQKIWIFNRVFLKLTIHWPKLAQNFACKTSLILINLYIYNLWKVQSYWIAPKLKILGFFAEIPQSRWVISSLTSNFMHFILGSIHIWRQIFRYVG